MSADLVINMRHESSEFIHDEQQERFLEIRRITKTDKIIPLIF